MSLSGVIGGVVTARALMLAALCSTLIVPSEVSAQLRTTPPALQSPPSSSPDVPRPPGDIPGATTLLPPGGGVLSPNPPPPPPAAAPVPLPPPAPSVQSSPMVPAGHIALSVAARYGRELPQITGGLIWRVYSDRPDHTGAFRPVKEERAAAPTFMLPPGGYVVHVTFGLASLAKPIQLRSETVRELFELPAGGLRVEGRVGDAKIPTGQISFSIYKGSQFEPGEKRPLAQNVMTGDVVLLQEGAYHIVSNYGDGNSLVRSDIRVQIGKLTDVAVTHRAAVITFKLVAQRGGEALANTDWIVESHSGDVIKEAIGAFPRVILAEGDYRAIARNEGRTYDRNFKVITGVDGEIEVMAR
jgi:hypothetical protein